MNGEESSESFNDCFPDDHTNQTETNFSGPRVNLMVVLSLQVLISWKPTIISNERRQIACESFSVVIDRQYKTVLKRGQFCETVAPVAQQDRATDS